MKKHIFAFICVFVIIFNTFNYTHTKAMDIGVAIDVGSEILYEGWDMIQSIFNGFVISLGQYAGYTDKAAAMGAYYNDWGDVLTVLTQGYLTPDQVEQSAISGTVYPLDFGMTGSIMRDFVNQYGNFVYDPTLGVYADINQKSIAAWNRFNDGWVNRYMNEFNKNIDSHPTNPDPQFITLLDNINKRDNGSSSYFWFYNYPSVINQSSTYSLNMISYPITDYTWFVIDNSLDFYNSGNTSAYLFCTDILNINITQTGGVYSFSVTANPINPNSYGYDSSSNRRYDYFMIRFNVNNTNWDNAGFALDNPVTFSYSGSLGQVLQYIGNKMKNVNIYVDGELWSYVSPVGTPLVSAPDHPIYDESGQIIGNDVYFPEQDLKADIVKFTELIDDKILTGDTIDLDDLIDAGVLTDAEGNIITDENRDEYIKKRDIASVITDALDDDVVTDLLPDAPNPPDDDPWNWNFPTIVIPEGGDTDPRGTGLSVLARIINVTNQSLPAEVITIFWGICITLVILGIIKILHK